MRRSAPPSPSRRAATVALALLLLAGALGGCASGRDPWQDARIESEVKARLVAETSANLTRLGVVSRRAVVYLSGGVASTGERALAERLTAGVPGVQRVVNTVEVRSTAARPR